MNTPQAPCCIEKVAISELNKLDCKTSHSFGRIYHPKGGWGGGRRRVLADREDVSSYHVMSRNVGGMNLLAEAEDKEGLRKLMWKLANFLFVRIQTYCIMDNHFHVLVQLPRLSKILKPFKQQNGEVIPKAKEVLDSEGEVVKVVELAPWEQRLISHLSSFYSKQYIDKLTDEIKVMRGCGNECQIKEMLDRYLERFCCLSHYMKELKERFSRWYNKKHKRKGTLWMDRFKSVLVEGSSVKMIMAAYIDLNPVRAGIVKDPQDYRWCGYAEAQGGSKRARRGLCRAMGVGLDDWMTSGAVYRTWLFDRGRQLEVDGEIIRKGVDPSVKNEVFSARGQQSLLVRLHQRIAYFTAGRVIGSQSFVNRFKSHRFRRG